MWFDVKSAAMAPVCVVDMQQRGMCEPGISAACTTWHAGLRQIFVGCTNGSVVGLYDSGFSKRGITLTAAAEGRTVKRKNILQEGFARIDDNTSAIDGTDGDLKMKATMNKYQKEKLRVKMELKRRMPQKPQKGDYGLIERGNTSHTFTQMVLRDKGTIY